MKEIFKPFCIDLLKVYKEEENKRLEELSDAQLEDHKKKILKNFEYLIIIARNLTPATNDTLEHELRIILLELWTLIKHFLEYHYVYYFH